MLRIFSKFFRCFTPVIIVCLLLQGGISSCVAMDCIEGNGRIAEQVRKVEDVNAVSVSGAFDVNLTVGSKEQLIVSADENLLPYLTTNMADGVLHVSTSRSVCSENSLEIRLFVHQLTSVIADGASSFRIDGVNAKNLTLRLSGANDLQVSGSVVGFDVDLSGAAELDAVGLLARCARVNIGGSAEAKVNVKDSLDAVISGVGDIYLLGNPAITLQNESGMGEILPLKD